VLPKKPKPVLRLKNVPMTQTKPVLRLKNVLMTQTKQDTSLKQNYAVYEVRPTPNKDFPKVSVHF
jgi:hypothetical protein